MSATLQERFAAALEARGETLVKKTAKAWVYTRTRPLNPDGLLGGELYFYLGRRGSLRVGATIADSGPVRNTLKQRLLEAK